MQKYLLKTCIITFFMTVCICTGCSKKNNEIVLSMQEEPADQESSAGEEISVSDDSEQNKSEQNKSEETNFAETDPKSEEDMIVYVCGAVECEGVYELPHGSRVVDAVKAAGGFSLDAETTYINQAQVLEDGVKLKIPTCEEVAALDNESLPSAGDVGASEGSAAFGINDGSNSDSSSASDSKININTASESELITIPGIGPSKASSIISYREENGKFSAIEDIMNVTGIKEKFFEKVKDHITV